MSNLHIGDVVHLTAEFRVDDVLTNPTTVQIEILAPGETVATYVYGTDSEIDRTATGLYYADIPLTEEGIWHYRWESTGTAAGAEEGSFFVAPSLF